MSGFRIKHSPQACNVGVPKNSIWGSLLFSICSNNLPAAWDGVETLMYANGTVIHAHGTDANVSAANFTMETVTGWSIFPYPEEKAVTMYFFKTKWPCHVLKYNTANVHLRNSPSSEAAKSTCTPWSYRKSSTAYHVGPKQAKMY